MAINDYTPTIWVDDSAPDIDAANLNHIENGIKNSTDAIKTIETGGVSPLGSWWYEEATKTLHITNVPTTAP